ncbi:MAG: UDP-N-acetylenolpyruvoylglucosamine reductase [Bacteroidetes bacterium CG23_combo_of_CG06-09_8_20_14_all_32_9]|nr:MAG: UDP-N-acetylenolpyruvoylglucosamine reductase [Bacteroidetes bacterium CG23_combo_of_CG06-09_8_20_14_all_32_9]
MNTYQNISLKPYNTFGIEALAHTFLEISKIQELNEIVKSGVIKDENFYILGGGSNILFTGNYSGTIIHPTFKGIKILEKNKSFALIKVFAGEIWDSFVDFCVENNFGGIENLSLIPGNCGASPVQNIGAFGVKVKDCVKSIDIFNIETAETKTLLNHDCQFGYRTSIFKNKFKHSWLITSTTYELTTGNHNFITHYGNVNKELKKLKEVSLKSIRQSVINIRTKKLPDPKEIGNAGSFFKNPVVSIKKANEILKTFSDAPTYLLSETETKLAAGWLIEKCGWKGKRVGNAGVHEKHALVLVNYGDAKGTEIINLSEEIKKSVFEKFGVRLETEVNFL